MNNSNQMIKKEIYALSNKKISANELFNILVYETMRNLIYKLSFEKVTDCEEIKKITESEVLNNETKLLNIHFNKKNHESMKTFFTLLKLDILTSEESNLIINECVGEAAESLESLIQEVNMKAEFFDVSKQHNTSKQLNIDFE